MRTSRHAAFVIFLTLVFSASGIIRAVSAEHPCVSAPLQAIAHDAGQAGHQHHHGAKEQPVKQSGAKCCGICVVAATGILTAPSDAADLIVSSVFYPADGKRLDGRWVLLDPGIPKHRS